MGQRAIIIGAGIGGLSTAIALYRIGWEVKVFEKAPILSEKGAGIVMAANAVKALQYFGLEKAISVKGARVEKAEIRSWNGKLLLNIPTVKQAMKFGTYSYLIHRGSLQRILLEKLKSFGVIPQVNKEFLSINENSNIVKVTFTDGSVAEGDLLIGADGVHSKIRQQLIGEDQLCYSGFTAFRGICSLKNDLNSVNVGGGFEAWGFGKRFGLSQLGEGQTFWFAAINSPKGMDISLMERKSFLLRQLQGWYPPIQEVINATEDTKILHHDIYDRKPLKKWSYNRITLLGDAAHSMLPNLGQGGAQAMEDAIVLARSLNKKIVDIPDSLHTYEQQRISRTTKIILQSRKMARMVQMDNPLLTAGRNSLLRILPANFFVKRLKWIQGFDI
ncbi:FAD-dependent monooxygenase [Evansella tamaricis]|uniref:FAD-dependent monooxygenase n=1 Tax=Evansella tamaricis TaxID=2069301 RepID=A0ABS6JH89_9BACI|nr:FAD-dependent monooxygenase [Evansella tamaricis]MBU9713044.1 FAD-dependent monooxygenase [Evansella tamaricis]